MEYLVDSHCHLASLSLKGKGPQTIDQVVGRAHYAGVTHMLCVACAPSEFAHMQEITAPYPEVFLALGMHPLNLAEEPDYGEDDFLKCFRDEKRLIAVGETGLDYYYERDSALRQQESFVRQIEIARAVKKPLIIHAREASNDIVSILREHRASDVRGIMHCYCDTVETARKCLDMGFYISFSGIATFKGSDNVRDVIKYVPDDRIMVETDCPYLAPVPVRGVENEPAFVRYTLDFIADFKKMGADALARLTSGNFCELFGLSLSDYPQTRTGGDFSTYKLDSISA